MPYLAMSARISPDGGDRAFVAGMRMLFGTAAAVVVALCTIPIGRWLTGSTTAQAYFGAACRLRTRWGGDPILVGATYRESAKRRAPASGQPEGSTPQCRAQPRVRHIERRDDGDDRRGHSPQQIGALLFQISLNDPDAGQLALASMGLVSGSRYRFGCCSAQSGLRALWLTASGLAIAGLTVFALIQVRRGLSMQIFLVAMQVLIVGLNFVFWAMLPNTIEYGEQETGLHVEGTVFGVAALLQRVAIGIATAILGLGFAPLAMSRTCSRRQRRSPACDQRWPGAADLPHLSCVAMVLNPLGRGTHRRIVANWPAKAARR